MDAPIVNYYDEHRTDYYYAMLNFVKFHLVAYVFIRFNWESVCLHKFD